MLKIAVLFDGAGLARLGLERAGHLCTGYELDPIKHYLGQFVGSGNSVLMDATKIDLSGYDAVWASPPCQQRSSARTQGAPISPYSADYLDWCLSLPHNILWVENILSQKSSDNTWGNVYNAAQFLSTPIQNRNRVIGGKYDLPKTFSSYKRSFKGLCPAITATEYKGCKTDKRRASRFYGRRLTIEECAYHQGFQIPVQWRTNPKQFGLTDSKWMNQLYEAIGNGVPVYMAESFGKEY